MLTLEEVLRILDGLREEALQAVEAPDETFRTEFGFGRVSGMLQAITQAKVQVTEAVNAAQKQAQSKFEEDDDQ